MTGEDSDLPLRGPRKRAELRVTALDDEKAFKGIHSQDSSFLKNWDSLNVVIFKFLPDDRRLKMKVLVA